MKKIGIIICDRYSTCAGGKCIRALKKREGAFSVYVNQEVELVGYTSCGGCPGENIEYAPEEMKKNVRSVASRQTIRGVSPGLKTQVLGLAVISS